MSSTHNEVRLRRRSWLASLYRLLFWSAALLVGCSDAGSLLTDLESQQQEIELLETKVSQNAAAIVRLAEATESAIAGIDTEGVPNSVVEQLGQLRRTAEAAASLAQEAFDRADDVATCVNEYMDIIGDWSSNVTSYYTYHYC